MRKILVIRLYFHYRLYMFRTVLVHLQLYAIFGISRYILAYTKYGIQLIKSCS